MLYPITRLQQDILEYSNSTFNTFHLSANTWTFLFYEKHLSELHFSSNSFYRHYKKNFLNYKLY